MSGALSTFWPLRLIAAFSLLAPALLFAYATWQSHLTIDAQATRRIESSLDVLQEHALKALQTVERSISEINEVLRGMPDERIRMSESDLYLRFKRTQQALPQMESIWAFDKDGHPLVSSTILPVPRNLDNSDRSYFRAHKDIDAGTFVGEVVRARVGALRFFVVSARRHADQPGRFNGVIAVTVMPEHFTEFYRKLTRGRDAFALVREDGSFLARLPELRLEELEKSDIADLIKRNPEAGIFSTVSRVDNVERRIGYRKVSGFPVYVQAGIETAALRTELWLNAATYLALGLPVSLALFGLALYALHRARRFEEETTRREAAEAALKQSQRLEALGQLTGGVAHDFNNLLMVVDGNLERIRRAVPADALPRRAVEAIENAVRRGANLTRQLLSFSRRQTHEAKVIDIEEQLPAIREMLRSSLRGDIAVETLVASGLWPTKIDVSEFELALLNLAVNARDAMTANGGRLTVSARNVTFVRPNPLDLEGDFVAVSVADTGAGIPSEILNRVFEPFFTTKDVGKGTGLGLSQVYGFAQQAGGTASIESKVGSGTTVTLYLPRCINADEDSAAVDDADGAGARTGGDRARVLLVEDNPEVAEVTRAFLEELGYSVVSAADVRAALEVLHRDRRQIQVVLSDIVMPGGANGLDLARRVRHEYGGAIPVVLATGYSEKAQAAADEGFTILRKPYNRAQLRETLSETLRRSALSKGEHGKAVSSV